MFLDPNRTAYDLNFRLFGVDVRVHPLFWLIAALFGFSSFQSKMEAGKTQEGFLLLLIWIGCMFVSILVHELGHVWMGQIFGGQGHIVLYGMGGLAIGSNSTATWWKRALIAFAGPLAGFALLGFLIVLLYLLYPGLLTSVTNDLLDMLGLYSVSLFSFQTPVDPNPYLRGCVRSLVFINFLWGLLNLLPVFPLDGGQITRDVLSFLIPRNGYQLSLVISILVAGVLAVHCYMYSTSTPPRGLIPFLQFGTRYTALLFGVLAFQSFMQLQQQHHTDPYDPWMGERRPWER